MERNGSFPVEIAIAGLILGGLLLLGSNTDLNTFRSAPPNLSAYDPLSRAEVKKQYEELVEARKLRKIARDGAPAAAPAAQPAKH